MTLYLAQHTNGYCLTRDASEHDPGYFVSTLCGHTILLPLSLDPYDEARVLEFTEDLEMCADCVRAARLEKGDDEQ